MQQIANRTELFDPERSDRSTDIEKDNNPLAKTAFVRQASHEIQGAFFGVASIGPMLKLAIENGEDPTILLDHLVEACRTYKHKLSNFLEYTRFDAAIQDSIREIVNIRLLLTRIIKENQHSATEKGITIDLHITDEMPELIVSDEFRIAQICTNLLSNAINFTSPGGSVLLHIDKGSNSNWVIIVEDEGEGMSTDAINGAFKLSIPERSNLRNPRGLGLIVTKYLVEDILKGKISLSGQLHKGTVCKVILPLTEGS